MGTPWRVVVYPLGTTWGQADNFPSSPLVKGHISSTYPVDCCGSRRVVGVDKPGALSEQVANLASGTHSRAGPPEPGCAIQRQRNPRSSSSGGCAEGCLTGDGDLEGELGAHLGVQLHAHDMLTRSLDVLAR